MYAKLFENKLMFAPQNKGPVLNYNTNVELMTQDGYKLFVPVEKPTTNRLYHVEYNETVEEIQEVIVYDETQEEANERERHEEDVRVANLTMTALDFIGILQQFGLTLIQVNEYLENHLELKTQLTYCQNVYCGVVQALCPLTAYDITITKEMVIHAFKVKNGEE